MGRYRRYRDVTIAGASGARGAVLGLAAAGALASGAPAQVREPCESGRIARIRIQSRAVFTDTTDGRLSKLYDAANWIHVETGEPVIRRELLFEEGDCYDPLRVKETERLLRAFPFLREASVHTSRRRDGDVNVSVVTQDDWSLRLDPRLDFGSGLGVTGLTLSEFNLWGSGRSIQTFYFDRPGRDEVGASFLDPQLFRSRWNLALRASRTEPGWSVGGSVAYPFVGLVGRWAAFQDVVFSERWFRFQAGDTRDQLILPFTRQTFQLGGAMRLSTAPRGTSTKLGTYGLTLSYERLKYEPIYYRDTTTASSFGLAEELANQVVVENIRPRRTLRLNLLVGIRELEFDKHQGLTTVRATEDIARGVAADLVLGLATRTLGTDDSHVLVGVDGYAGATISDGWLSQVRGVFEGRRDYERREWRDLFGGLEWSNYWRLSPAQSLVLTGKWAAGWNATVPFQLTLGGPTGVRGYATHRFPGGARAVASVEHRAYLTSFRRLFDLGSTLFLDVGHMWRNEALFGTNSDLRASIGAGLRIAVPSGTRQTYRVELAAPLERSLSLDELVFRLEFQPTFSVDRAPGGFQLFRSRDVALSTAERHLQ